MKIKAVIAAVVLAALSLTGCSAPSEKGLEYLQEEEYDKAIEEFQKAVDKDDNPGDAYRGIGIAKWEQEDYEGALEAFKSALENGAEKTGTLYNFIGCCALRVGDASSALNYFNLGISQEDNSEELLQEMKFNVVSAYEQMEDWESAMSKLQAYLQEYPDDEKAQKEMTFLETRL